MLRTLHHYRLSHHYDSFVTLQFNRFLFADCDSSELLSLLFFLFLLRILSPFVEQMYNFAKKVEFVGKCNIKVFFFHGNPRV